MIDSSRVYRPLWELRNIIDVSVANKLNVLHMHLTDDQGWTIEIKSYPLLTANCSDGGSMGPHGIYTQDDIAGLLEYARVRGVRLVPEIDSPGHWNTDKCYPNILPHTWQQDGVRAPPDPSNPDTWTFFTKVLGEMANMFPDKYFHVGGDEFNSAAWQNNAKVQAWAKQNNLNSIAEIEGWYQSKMKGILTSLNKTAAAWTPGICDSPGAPTLTHMVWHGGSTAMNDIQHYTLMGEQVILADSNWYVHKYGEPAGIKEFESYYGVDVYNWPGASNQSQASLLLGGQGCVWGDLNKEDEFQNAWPLLATTAEIWWSPREVPKQGASAAEPRYRVHNQRMQARGLPTQDLP
jgi:hexosaminidase